METYNEQDSDSLSKNSYIGSYYQPPDRMIPLSRRLDFPFHTSISIDQPTTSQQGSQAKTNIGSKAVVDALRALQEKIRVQDLKTSKQAERSRLVSQDAQTHQQATVFDKTHRQAATLPLTYKQRQKETDGYTQLEPLEACKLLQKQVEKTKKTIERAKKEHSTLLENQKASRHHCELKSPKLSRNSKMPFVAGTSTSPSHSVHANVQSILHMMKHHQPQLCERVGALHMPSCGAKKCLQKDFSQSNITVQRRHSETSDAEESLGTLSDLLLALQDELGQMSFEHRELMCQIDDTHDHKKRQDLKNELEQLVARMEDKGAQITKLRKHQQMVHKLTKTIEQAPCCEEIHPPAPSPVKAQKKGKKQAPTQSNLQLLRETQQFRNSLKQSDLIWET